MADERVRVSVQADDEATRETVYDSAGEVDAGDATFRFDVGGAAENGTEATDQSQSERERETTSEESERDTDGADDAFVASVEAVPTDTTVRRTAMRPDGRRGVEFVLRRDADADEVFAWVNSCPHRPEVPLDPGRGARVDGGEIVCHEHGARFECGDGLCTWGPCVGEQLEPVGVTVEDGAVYLTDDRFVGVRES